ncbi:MAG TPA: alpha/beta fold hydrolase [Syntrophales bacterium]|nr:alpha/beta fold hydrolase [Syntrophales bacterium]
MTDDCFLPEPWARHRHLQSMFASMKIRALGDNPMLRASRESVVDAGDGARLLGFHSPQREGKAPGLVVLLHGWEGSSESTYILTTGRFLYRCGYDVFRLNLRDHGNSHHLNEDLFHGARLEEVFQALSRIAELGGGRPFFIIGFSLGGNFGLRVSRLQVSRPIPSLRHVISISPALDPYKSTLLIDSGFFLYRSYFLNKWKRSLRKKESLFPGKYRFGPFLRAKTCMELTEALMPYFPEYPTYRDYFRQYTLLGDSLCELGVPTTIIASADDPVVPVEDLRGLKKGANLHLALQRYGGHCGFLGNPFPFGCWYEKEIADILNSAVSNAGRTSGPCTTRTRSYGSCFPFPDA